MIVYIDGSGSNYRTERQVHVALCVPKEANRHLPGFLFQLKGEVYGVTETAEVDPIRAMEIKAERILNRSTFNRALVEGNEEALKYVTLVERIFEELASVKEFKTITIFAIVMPLLNSEPCYPPGHLPNPLRFLLQRVNRLVEEDDPERTAILVLDRGNEILGDDRELLSRFFSHWYNRFDNFQYIFSTPFFVDSRLTPGIELADLVAGCLRLCWENNLVPEYLRPQWDRPGTRSLLETLQDPFLSSLKRYLNVILAKVRNVKVGGEEYYGIYAPGPEKFELCQEVEPSE